MADCYNKIYLKKQKIYVECGKCLNCLAEKRKENAIRFVHETDNKDYPYRYMLTLTYDEVHAHYKNGENTLCKKDLTEYIEKLQRRVRYLNKKVANGFIKFKYFACGEYGGITQRAHYHVIIATNWFIEGRMRGYWRKGFVRIDKNISIKAVAYACGYSQKKIGYNDKKYINKESPFRKFSRGLGKEWIHEAIAKKKITKEKYYIDTNFWGKVKLPTYYKNIIRETVMGVKPRRYVLKPEERLYRKTHFGDDRKTIMINQDSYDENYWKWDKYISVIKDKMSEKFNYLFKERDIKRYENISELIYNLIHNEEYEIGDKENYKVYAFKKLWENINLKRKCEAENKYWRTAEKRVAV